MNSFRLCPTWFDNNQGLGLGLVFNRLRLWIIQETTHLNVAKHLLQVVALAAQGQVIEDILVHELNVRVAQFDGSIGVPAIKANAKRINED